MERIFFGICTSLFITLTFHPYFLNPQLYKPINPSYIGQIRGKYNFKAAYFCDFQGLHQQALGYYRNCFQSLISVVENVQDHLLGELQLMTELCNYKICRYLVSASMVSDAILQFEEHMAAIKSCYPTQLDFVHHGWMAKQYIVFVNLLDYADINSDGHSKNSERVQTATGKPLSRQTIQHSRAQYVNMGCVVRGLFLCSIVFVFHYYWCIRKP